MEEVRMSFERPIPWTPDEESTLLRVYPVGGMRAALAALPNRLPGAIKNKAQRMGLDCPELRTGGGCRERIDFKPALPTTNEPEQAMCRLFVSAMRAMRVPASERRAFL
jgi:hypothetical protein